MNLSHITSQSLRRVLSLTERKDELISLVAEIESEIAKTLTGIAAPVAAIANAPFKSAPKRQAKRARRAGRKSGGLKTAILGILESAGTEGVRVKDIAAKLGKSSGNVSVWFSTTGKDITTKLSNGLYAAKSVSVPAVVAKPAKPARARKAVKVVKAPKVAKVAKVAKVKKAAKPAREKRASGMSAAGRARISAASKARWEKVRAAKAAA